MVYNPVTGLTATARYSQIDVSWDAQPDAPSFWVRAKIAGRQVKWETVCAPAHSITLRNMDQGTAYTITCWAGLDGPGNNTSVTVTTKGSKPATAMPTVTTTVPCGEPPQPTGTNFAANPSAHGYPDATNTGAILGPLTVLQAGASGNGWSYNGSLLTISGSGVTVDSLDVAGQIMVNGSNVTVRNCRVIGNAFNGNGITVGGPGYLIDHCSVQGANDTSGGFDAGIKGKGGNTIEGTINACHIINCRSGTQDTAGYLQNSYIHQMRHASGDHINGMTQNGGTDGLVIQHNTIFNAYSQTDAVGLFGDFGQEGNDTVIDNILAGGGYTVYGGAGGPGGNPVNIKILNNRISNKYFPEGGYWGWLAYEGPASMGNVTSGNIWDATGELI